MLIWTPGRGPGRGKMYARGVSDQELGPHRCNIPNILTFTQVATRTIIDLIDKITLSLHVKLGHV